MSRVKFKLETGGEVIVWATRYNEVCIVAADVPLGPDEDLGDEEIAFAQPNEARAIAAQILKAADEAEREVVRDPDDDGSELVDAVDVIRDLAGVLEPKGGERGGN